MAKFAEIKQQAPHTAMVQTNGKDVERPPKTPPELVRPFLLDNYNKPVDFLRGLADILNICKQLL